VKGCELRLFDTSLLPHGLWPNDALSKFGFRDEFNAAHAFLRDEDVRYNPALARVALALLLRFLAEKFG
jgi:dienelactone hydrolase